MQPRPDLDSPPWLARLGHPWLVAGIAGLALGAALLFARAKLEAYGLVLEDPPARAAARGAPAAQAGAADVVVEPVAAATPEATS